MKIIQSDIATWEEVEKMLTKLSAMPIRSAEELVAFWEAVGAFAMAVGDGYGSRYIAMTRHADDETVVKEFHRFVEEVSSRCEPHLFSFKKKLIESPYASLLPERYAHLLRIVQNEVSFFREENVALGVEEEKLSAKYGAITSKMTVAFDGGEKTIQQLGVYLENPDRAVREAAWRAMFSRYNEDKDALDAVFDELKNIRVRMARNAGFPNYRDYAHRRRGRISYTVEDIFPFHDAIERVIVPLVEEFSVERQAKLGVATLRPWDMKADIAGNFPKPFATHEELLEKGMRVLSRVDAEFEREFGRMRENDHIDAENRKGKAPGGYCYPLYREGSSFIFMHANGTRRDVETLVHEAGHSMHNRAKADENIFEYRECPSEVAELASMSMELLSFFEWTEFYGENDLRAIYAEELKEKLVFLPWEAAVDAFQHWLYTHPDHTPEERDAHFAGVMDRFRIGGDWTGLEKEKAMRWMMQLHIFEVPFYYIEYAMAQLGALAVWRNFRRDPQKTIADYKNFLRFGYSGSVADAYAATGIRFDFSLEYVTELADFVKKELS